MILPLGSVGGMPRVCELSCIRGGLRIHGMACLPCGMRGRVKTVIMSHGFGVSGASNLKYAEAFAKAGVASYVFDFCGGSGNGKSDGSMSDMSVLTEADDLNAVLDFVKTLDFVDTNNLYLMGGSQGGFVSALVAAQRADEVKGLVLLYPAFVIPALAGHLHESEGGIPEQSDLMGFTVGRRYYADAVGLDIYNDIKGYGKDVLIIHGDMDELVPLAYSGEAAKAYASAELLVIKGAGHGFHDLHATQAIDKMLDYIAKQGS